MAFIAMPYMFFNYITAYAEVSNNYGIYLEWNALSNHTEIAIMRAFFTPELEKINRRLSRIRQLAYETETMPIAPFAKAPYEVAEVDLNMDGAKEILVRWYMEPNCKDNSCIVSVLSNVSGRYELTATIAVEKYGNFKVLTTITNGFYDISTNQLKWYWNEKSYAISNGVYDIAD
jgi:hypothetical protein